MMNPNDSNVYIQAHQYGRLDELKIKMFKMAQINVKFIGFEITSLIFVSSGHI